MTRLTPRARGGIGACLAIAGGLAVCGLAACDGGPAGPPEPIDAEPVYRSAGVSVGGGVLTTAYEIENPRSVPIRFTLATGCYGGIITQLFQPGDPTGAPLWSEDAVPLPVGGCKIPPRATTLDPEEVVLPVDEHEIGPILGDSIAPGVYEVRAVVVQLEPVRRDIPLILGEADLGG